MLRKVFSWIAVILMIIGSLNWLLIGVFNFNLLTTWLHLEFLTAMCTLPWLPVCLRV